jgi:hypothetical protein
MIRESQVRDRLLEVLQGHLSLGEFESWLVRESWDMHRDSSPGSQDLVANIELLLAERSSRELGNAAFFNELVALASNISSAVEWTSTGVGPLQNVPRLQPSSSSASSYQVSAGPIQLQLA